MPERTDGGRNLYVVTVEDTVVQQRDYVVIAVDRGEAESKVAAGLFLSESEPTTFDTKQSSVKDIVFISIEDGYDEDENGNLLP